MTNKELATTALTEIFVNKNVSAFDLYWSEDYIQHNPTIENGTAHLKNMIPNLPSDFKYEMGLAVADGDFVMIHGRYTGWGSKPLVAVDIFKVKNGKLVEHWDVMQEDVPAEQTASKNPMFPAE